jgi:hypothetical protein
MIHTLLNEHLDDHRRIIYCHAALHWQIAFPIYDRLQMICTPPDTLAACPVEMCHMPQQGNLVLMNSFHLTGFVQVT